MVKRAGDRRESRAKRSRNLVPVVVDALADTEALPSDLRSVFKHALPEILEQNKAERHPYEAEVVAEAEKAFSIVLTSIVQSHKEALQKQNEVISPSEHSQRTKAKKDAEAALEALTKKLEANKEAQSNSRKAVHDAQSHLKAVQKESAAAEKEMQACVSKKTNLSDLLANEFVALQQETSLTPDGKTAVKKLLAVGKEYGLDSTLLTTFPITCKKEPSVRTEFENMMFTSLKAAIDRQIDHITQNLAKMEPTKAEKLAAVGAAEESLEKAQAALSAANEEHSATQAAHKEADKAVTKADEFLYQIWNDMKEACDAQDDLADSITGFKETMQSFNQLRDREPEPEPVEEPEPSDDAAAEGGAEAVAAEAAPAE